MGMLDSMFNSKYSKLLTVILIFVIIAVVGLLAFLGYDVYTKYTIESETGDAVSRFEEQFNQTNTTQNVVENVIENTVQNIVEPDIEPDVGSNTVTNTTSNNNDSSSSGNKTTYKGYEVIGTIEIPKTNIKYPIIKQEDVGLESLKVAICNLYGTLNEVGGNAILVGHNYRNGTFFSNNKKLSNGDKIYITDNSGKKVTYIVKKKYETSTGDFDYATRKIDSNKREISLSTCTDDSKKRLIIWAEEQ